MTPAPILGETEARHAAKPRWRQVAVPLAMILLVTLTFVMVYEWFKV